MSISISRTIGNKKTSNSNKRYNNHALSSSWAYIPTEYLQILDNPEYILFKYSELHTSYILQLVDIDSISKKGVQKVVIMNGCGGRIGTDKYIEVGKYDIEKIDDITFKLVKL